MVNLTFQEQGHIYRMNGIEIPSVTQIIKAGGLADFSNVNPEILDRSIQFGNAVHKAVELKCKDTLDNNSVDNAIKGHILQWERFCADFHFESEIQEHKFFHKLGYAGTIDHIGKIGQNGVLVDIKTGSVKCADIVQVCAYGLAVYADRLLIVYLDDDKYKIIEPKRQERRAAEQIFLSALSLYNYRKKEGLL